MDEARALSRWDEQTAAPVRAGTPLRVCPRGAPGTARGECSAGVLSDLRLQGTVSALPSFGLKQNRFSLFLLSLFSSAPSQLRM